ncbi:MAG: AAA family ATPase [Vicinamibacterales bacterium]
MAEPQGSPSGQLVVIVSGLPGTGKTTLGRAIADHFGWPFISKDVFKELMFDTIGWSDKEWSLKVSAATHRIMDYVIGEILTTGHSVVVESNFKNDLDAPRFERLRALHGATLVQLLCWAEGNVLFERYKKRLESDRHPGHGEAEALDIARASLAVGKAEPMAIDARTIEVDTTYFDAVDLEGLFHRLGSP